MHEHRYIIIASSLPIQCIFPAFPRRLERGSALGAACACAAAAGHALFSNWRQSIRASHVIRAAASTPFRSCASFKESRTLAQDESVQKVAMLSSSARIAEYNLDIAGVRKDRELVLRRMAVLAAVVGARMSVPSCC